MQTTRREVTSRDPRDTSSKPGRRSPPALVQSAPRLARVRGGAVVATARAFQAGLERRQQKQCEIGLQSAAEYPMHRKHGFGAELASATLIRLSRIVKRSQRTVFPTTSAGSITSAMACARSANMSAIFQPGAPGCRNASQAAVSRMRSPVAVRRAGASPLELSRASASTQPGALIAWFSQIHRVLPRVIKRPRCMARVYHRGRGKTIVLSCVLQEVGFLTMLGAISFFTRAD